MTPPPAPALPPAEGRRGWHEEHEPFPAFLRTLTPLELAVMQHEARQCGDTVTVAAVLAELKRRVTP
jgi:hypothetical protein